MAKAEETALRLAAVNILAQMGKNRREAVSPDVVNSMMNELGGPKAFGAIIASEIKKARGEIDPANAGHYKPSQALTHKWLELSSRIMLHNDDRQENVGLGAMSEDELVNTLRGLALELAKTNEEFGRIVAFEAVRKSPSLLKDLNAAYGMVDGVVVGRAEAPEVPRIASSIADAGLEEDEAFGE